MLELADIRYFFGELVEPLNYKYLPTPCVFSRLSLPPRLPKVNFVSALCVLVLLEEELLRFRFKEVMLGYLAFKYVVMLLDFCLALLVVVLALLCFKSCLS
jgi:hypothetical protein